MRGSFEPLLPPNDTILGGPLLLSSVFLSSQKTRSLSPLSPPPLCLPTTNSPDKKQRRAIKEKKKLFFQVREGEGRVHHGWENEKGSYKKVERGKREEIMQRASLWPCRGLLLGCKFASSTLFRSKDERRMWIFKTQNRSLEVDNFWSCVQNWREFLKIYSCLRLPFVHKIIAM